MDGAMLQILYMDTIVFFDGMTYFLWMDSVTSRSDNIVGHTITPMVRYYFEEYEAEGEKEDTDIFRIGNKLWCIDCGNGYRDDDDFPGKLGCIELSARGKVTEHYV